MDFVQENERESAAAAAAAGAAAGAAAASASRAGAGRRRPSRLSIYRVPRRPSTGKLNWGKGPFPENLWTEVVYSDQFQLTCTAGALQQYTFAMNGLYDPNLTGTGSQPRYFDTLCGANTTAAPYRAYVVKAARMKVMAYAQGPDSAGIPSVVAISGIAGTSTGPSTVTEQMQRNDTNYRLLSYYAGGKPIATVYRTCEVAPTWRQRHRRCQRHQRGLFGKSYQLGPFRRDGCSAQSEHGSRHQPQRRNPILGQVLLLNDVVDS